MYNTGFFPAQFLDLFLAQVLEFVAENSFVRLFGHIGVGSGPTENRELVGPIVASKRLIFGNNAGLSARKRRIGCVAARSGGCARRSPARALSPMKIATMTIGRMARRMLMMCSILLSPVSEAFYRRYISTHSGV